MTSAIKSFNLLGFKITPLTVDQLIGIVGDLVVTGSTGVIASMNLHGVYSFFKDERFRALHLRDDTFVHIDGMPIILMGRLCGLPVRREHRTAWIDWFMPLMAAAERNRWRTYYLGGNRAVLERGLARIRDAHRDLRIEGHDGYFDARPDGPENEAVIEAINAFRPHLLVVGMGMGRQEHWILDNIDRLQANCIATSGACIEYFAGAVPTPPRWTGQIGLEWAYRLCTNPRRFAWRYLIEPWVTVWLMAAYHARRGLGLKRPQT